MEVAKTTVPSGNVDQKQWYRVGGISALVIGLAYLVIVFLYARVGAPPTGGEAWFRYLPGKTTSWWAILGLSVLTDFLFVPVAFALYLALKGVSRNAMLLATAFVGLFVVLDLAVTWSHYASLLVLFSNYSRATDPVQQGADLAAANYASAVLASPLEIVYAIVTLSTGFLVTGIVMLRGVFNKFTAYLGVATGILGIVSLTGFSLAIIMNALFATVWVLVVGYRLCRLAQE
jgi:hypothetical protein